jgi:translation initiation factor IF-3
VGIVAIGIALQMAQESDLDLVEVAPMARPPVAKLMDYGKFKYETAQKARESRKNQVLTVIKEMKLRPKIDPHDYETKKGHVVRFLKAGDKVKITIMFRGREQSRPELGFRLLQRLGEDVNELGFVESSPKQDGRNMIMVLAPHKNAADLKKIAADQKAAEGGRAGQAQTEAVEVSEPTETTEVSEPTETTEVSEPTETTEVSEPTETSTDAPSDTELDATDGTPSVETDS